jgi:tetratricopeptide (TPR) repeat protein
MYSNYAAVASFLGFKLRDQNDIRGTLDAWRFAMLFGTRNPDTWKLRYNLGILYVNLGQIDSAERYFDEIKTNDPRLVAQIGMLYNMVGIHEKAAEYFQKSISMDPRNPHSHMGLLATYLEMNDTVKAIVVLQNWIQQNPGDTQAQRMLKGLQEKNK